MLIVTVCVTGIAATVLHVLVTGTVIVHSPSRKCCTTVVVELTQTWVFFPDRSPG